MRLSIAFDQYALGSAFAFLCLLSYTVLSHESSYLALSFLCSARTSIAIVYNFFFMVLFGLARLILQYFLGNLRDLEAEQVFEAGRGFLMDTVMFLILSNPTIDGREVTTLGLLKLVGTVVVVKSFHLICQIRVGHIFEVGLPQSVSLGRLFGLMVLLTFVDFIAVVNFYALSNKASSLYLWLLFEGVGMLISSSVTIIKFCLNLVDSRLESGWPAKSAYIFFFDVLGDIAALAVFFVFMVSFIVYYPAHLPMHMTSDLIHVVRTLYLKLRSFMRYRKLMSGLGSRFPDASLEELESADTCIICRDMLTIGCKRLPCSHVFHMDCLKAWFVQQQSCPTCRADILSTTTTVTTSPPANQHEVAGVTTTSTTPAAASSSQSDPDQPKSKLLRSTSSSVTPSGNQSGSVTSLQHRTSATASTDKPIIDSVDGLSKTSSEMDTLMKQGDSPRPMSAIATATHVIGLSNRGTTNSESSDANAATVNALDPRSASIRGLSNFIKKTPLLNKVFPQDIEIDTESPELISNGAKYLIGSSSTNDRRHQNGTGSSDDLNENRSNRLGERIRLSRRHNTPTAKRGGGSEVTTTAAGGFDGPTAAALSSRHRRRVAGDESVMIGNRGKFTHGAINDNQGRSYGIIGRLSFIMGGSGVEDDTQISGVDNSRSNTSTNSRPIWVRRRRGGGYDKSDGAGNKSTADITEAGDGSWATSTMTLTENLREMLMRNVASRIGLSNRRVTADGYSSCTNNEQSEADNNGSLRRGRRPGANGYNNNTYSNHRGADGDDRASGAMAVVRRERAIVKRKDINMTATGATSTEGSSDKRRRKYKAVAAELESLREQEKQLESQISQSLQLGQSFHRIAMAWTTYQEQLSMPSAKLSETGNTNSVNYNYVISDQQGGTASASPDQTLPYSFKTPPTLPPYALHTPLIEGDLTSSLTITDQLPLFSDLLQRLTALSAASLNSMAGLNEIHRHYQQQKQDTISHTSSSSSSASDSQSVVHPDIIKGSSPPNLPTADTPFPSLTASANIKSVDSPHCSPRHGADIDGFSNPNPVTETLIQKSL